MNNSNQPEISVVMVTPDSYKTISKTVNHLRAQTVRDKLEIVIVTPSADNLNANASELKEFFQSKVIESVNMRSMGHAQATGLRNASARVVVFAEDHSFPENGWAEALIEAHRQPWAAVGPVISNANPESSISWADLLIGYGPWLEGNSGGVMYHLPGHNCSYKLKVLQEYGSELESLLEAESVLHWDLRSKGYELYLEPAARTSHLNFGTLSSFIKSQYNNSRLFAATRRHNWSILRRILYTLGSILIPVVRFLRALKDLANSGNFKKVRPSVYPSLLLGLCVSSIGEMLGYSIGLGNSKKEFYFLHFHRNQHTK